jgi:hypothetical protein
MHHKLFIGLSAALAAIVANVVPLLDTHPEQDDCTFGPVSNADYREYLASAKAQLAVTPAFYLDGRAAASEFGARLDKLSRGETDIYARLAIMHAVLRAAGAEYRNTNGNQPDRGRSDPFLFATTGAPTISFNYLLDVNRTWIFSPLLREAWVIGVLAGPLYTKPPGPSYPKKTGGISFIVHAPDFKTWPAGFDVKRNDSCPPIPTADVVPNFSIRSE